MLPPSFDWDGIWNVTFSRAKVRWSILIENIFTRSPSHHQPPSMSGQEEQLHGLPAYIYHQAVSRVEFYTIQNISTDFENSWLMNLKFNKYDQFCIKYAWNVTTWILQKLHICWHDNHPWVTADWRALVVMVGWDVEPGISVSLMGTTAGRGLW